MAIEYRGFRDLVYAELVEDSAANYTAGTVKPFAPAGEISKSVEQASVTKYYDNLAALVITSRGADTVELTTAIIPPEVLAEVTGQYYDVDTGALSEGAVTTPKYFALGYKLGEVGDVGDTGEAEVYVWRYKGSFSVPNVASKTEDSGTDSQGQSITFTGINTEHAFTKGGSAKAIAVELRLGLADVADFFAQVTTIDTLLPKAAAKKQGKA
jgi:phi13 family phage major tail protein